jgi:autotransporter translocation and assembly factor TamB
VARALDFDLFEVTPTDDASGGAILTVGRQINDKLFVGFRQQFGAEEVSQVTFEYRLTQFLRIVTSFAQGTERVRTGPHTERMGADFVFVIRR